MAKVHYCRCRINLSGQNCHIIKYDEHDPVTWPEVQVLMMLHGEENVMDVIPVSVADIAPAQEKERLISKYGYRTVERVFPGRAFRMQLMMTDDDELPAYVEGGAQDRDDDAAQDVAHLAAQTPVFKPGRNVKPQAEPPKGA